MESKEWSKETGYKGALRRGLGFLSTSCLGFNTIAVMTGIAVAFGEGLSIGGPAVLIWGWIGAFALTLIVSLSMAEICSAYPMAGGVYHWTAQVVPRNIAAPASYVCGWCSLLGGIMVTSLGCATVAGLINAALIVSTGASYSLPQQVGIAVVSLVGMASVNIARIDEIGLVSTIMGAIHFATLVILGIAVLSLPSKLNHADDVFFHYNNYTGFKDASYVSAIGLLVPAFIFAGYDASAQMAEETKGSSTASPFGMVTAVVAAGLAGFFVLLSLLLATVDVDAVVHGDTDYPLFNVFMNYLPHEWACALCWLVVVNVFFSIMSWVAVTTRRAYALARDDGLPLSGLLSYLEPHFQSPIACTVFVVLFATFFLLFLLDSELSVAYDGMVSLSVIGLHVSYCIPILLRLVFMPPDFPSGDFSLGVLSVPLGVVSCFWLLSVAVLGFLPTMYPVTATNMNWAVVVAAGYALLAFVNWMVYSRHYFEGPKHVAEQGKETIVHESSSSDSPLPVSPPPQQNTQQKSPGTSESVSINDRRLSAKKMRKNWFVKPEVKSSAPGKATSSVIDI